MKTGSRLRNVLLNQDFFAKCQYNKFAIIIPSFSQSESNIEFDLILTLNLISSDVFGISNQKTVILGLSRMRGN